MWTLLMIRDVGSAGEYYDDDDSDDNDSDDNDNDDHVDSAYDQERWQCR